MRHCDRHGTWHRETCDEIDTLRAGRVPRIAGQLAFGRTCPGCGEPRGGEPLCQRCEAAVRVAEHTGRTDGLTARQLRALDRIGLPL